MDATDSGVGEEAPFRIETPEAVRILAAWRCPVLVIQGLVITAMQHTFTLLPTA